MRAVPFEEDDHDPSIWFLDHSFLEGMYKMYKKINGVYARVRWLHGRVRASMCARCGCWKLGDALEAACLHACAPVCPHWAHQTLH